MRRRAVGASPLVVSELALGTWLTLGDELDEAQGRAVVDAAFDLGITLFDTADVYAGGEAERALGRALRGRARDTFQIATKCFFPTGEGPDARGLSRAHVQRSVERSLRALDLDHLDLLQCHRYDPDVPLAETCGALQDLVRAGKIRQWGIGRCDAARTRAVVRAADALGGPRPAAHQHVYHLLLRDIAADVAPACAELGLGLLIHSPLAQGVLTGKYTAGMIPEGSRAARPEARERMWELRPESLARVARFQRLAEDAGSTLLAAALGWCLRLEAVSSVIVGARTPAQLAECVRAASVPLPAELAARLESA